MNIKEYLSNKIKEFMENAELKRRIPLYEESYRESQSRKPELPELESLADIKKKKPEEYVKQLDELAHMRSSIDAALDAAIIAKEKGLPPADATVFIGKAVHDAWCCANKQKFTDEKRTDRKWQFLSSEAIGWQEFEKDLKNVLIAMQKVGFSIPEMYAVKAAYDIQHEKYRSLTPEERRISELTRWINLSQKVATDFLKENPEAGETEKTAAEFVKNLKYKTNSLNGTIEYTSVLYPLDTTYVFGLSNRDEQNELNQQKECCKFFVGDLGKFSFNQNFDAWIREDVLENSKLEQTDTIDIVLIQCDETLGYEPKYPNAEHASITTASHEGSIETWQAMDDDIRED